MAGTQRKSLRADVEQWEGRMRLPKVEPLPEPTPIGPPTLF
ncbi:MAG TPA: hypothetical protein VFX60_09490 [Micromonospora sp.]|nr:hypothetical protein [Micromonospora sp.]